MKHTSHPFELTPDALRELIQTSPGMQTLNLELDEVQFVKFDAFIRELPKTDFFVFSVTKMHDVYFITLVSRSGPGIYYRLGMLATKNNLYPTF